MENPLSELVEMERPQSPTADPVDLSVEDLEKVGGAFGDCGIIEIEK